MEEQNAEKNYGKKRNIIIKAVVVVGLLCFFIPFVSVSCGAQKIELSGFELMFPGVTGDSTLEELSENWILVFAFACGIATFFTVAKSELEKTYISLPGATVAGILLSRITAASYYDLSETDMEIIQFDAGWSCTLFCFCICILLEWALDSEESNTMNGSNIFSVPIQKISSARILCVSGIYIDGEFSILEGETLCMGRDPEVANLVFSEKNISRKHCVLSLKDGEFMIEDVSSFGTYVNGEKIKEGQPVILRDGDKVKIGDNEFMVILDCAGN